MKIKRETRFIVYREIQGSSNESFKTEALAHKYAKKMGMENYQILTTIYMERC